MKLRSFPQAFRITDAYKCERRQVIIRTFGLHIIEEKYLKKIKFDKWENILAFKNKICYDEFDLTL